jgi:hypothetical protein
MFDQLEALLDNTDWQTTVTLALVVLIFGKSAIGVVAGRRFGRNTNTATSGNGLFLQQLLQDPESPHLDVLPGNVVRAGEVHFKRGWTGLKITDSRGYSLTKGTTSADRRAIRRQLRAMKTRVRSNYATNVIKNSVATVCGR